MIQTHHFVGIWIKHEASLIYVIFLLTFLRTYILTDSFYSAMSKKKSKIWTYQLFLLWYIVISWDRKVLSLKQHPLWSILTMWRHQWIFISPVIRYLSYNHPIIWSGYWTWNGSIPANTDHGTTWSGSKSRFPYLDWVTHWWIQKHPCLLVCQFSFSKWADLIRETLQ